MVSKPDSPLDPAFAGMLARYARLDIDAEAGAALASELRQLRDDLALLRRSAVDDVEPALRSGTEDGA